MEPQNFGPKKIGTSLAGVQGNPDRAVKNVLGAKTLGRFEGATAKEQEKIIAEVAKLRESFKGEDPKLFFDAVCELLGISADGQNIDKYKGSGPLTASLSQFLQQAGVVGSRRGAGGNETVH